MTDDERGRLLRAAGVGVVAGLASGLFGVGGGIVIVPALVAFAHLDQRRAHGTSLTAIVPIALAGAIGYSTGGQVDWPAALLTVLGAIVGAPIGVALLARLPQRQLRIGFAALLFLSAVRLAFVDADGAGREAIDAVLGGLYVVTGVASGILAGVMGVGGGIIMVPIYTILFGMPIVLAKGTSLAVIFPTAIIGTIRNRAQGTTDLPAGIVVGLAGVVTAALASQVSLGLDPRVSRSTFAALLVVVVGRMVLRLRRDARATVAPGPAEG